MSSPFLTILVTISLSAVISSLITYVYIVKNVSIRDRISKDIEKKSNQLLELTADIQAKADEIRKLNLSAKSAFEEFSEVESNLVEMRAEKSSLEQQLVEARETFKSIFSKTENLRKLEKNHLQIAQELEENSTRLSELREQSQKVREIASKLDLYTRLDTMNLVGHFQVPEYLHETSDRFKEEIKLIREKQKKMISDDEALILEDNSFEYLDKQSHNRLISAQSKLMLNTFNIESDLLIGKVSHSNYSRTLEQIENKANSIEKMSAELFLGFNIEYIKLKLEECTLQYQFKLKKKEEQEEERFIREQLREEKKAEKEYQDAIKKAEAEEKLYQDMLVKARAELEFATDSERLAAESKIAELEKRLAEAVSQEQRARSMAEQTKRGFVYVISNIGSFGEGVFKIGLTRRLEPLDRVRELGDASVPFTFDVHALIAAEDAPALEAQLHREFSEHRVNVVNNRKEFFKVELEKIEQAVKKITGKEYDFNSEVEAEEYFESLKFA